MNEGLKRIGGAALLAAGLLLHAQPALAQGITEISSAGPLTRIFISPELNCQVAHAEDVDAFEFYDAGSELGGCGTWLAVDGVVYGPSSGPSLDPATAYWTPISQSPVGGSGSAADPYRVVTVVAAGATGVRVEETDSYVVGEQSYRTALTITNSGSGAVSLVVYRGGDCYLHGSDIGYGRVDGSAPACVASLEAGVRIEQWLPLNGGNNWFEGDYSEFWSLVASGQPLPDRCECDIQQDNGAGISWSVALGQGQAASVSHDTFFSPHGRAPAAVPLRSSVPDPFHVSLDPVTVATSAVVTAGVVLLVPFPSALVNNTFEENYVAISAALAAMRSWFTGLVAIVWARLVAAIRRRRAGSAGQPAVEVAGPIRPPLPSADFWLTLPGMVVFILISALFYALLDPTFGLSLTSVAEYVGLAIGLAVVLAAYGLPLIIYARRHGLGLTVRALPATLLLAIACVLISRLANFQPGYLYGLVIGFYFAGAIPSHLEGPANAAAAVTSLVVAALAWIGLAILRAGDPGGAELSTIALETAAVTVVVAGVEAVFFTMLPLRFMDGAAVFAWNRRAWAVIFGMGIFAFAHVLLNPSAGYLADATRSSFVTTVALLIGFGLFSVLFWAWFRIRRAEHVEGG